MLTIDNISSAYGNSQVLFDLSLSVAEGEIIALMGRNGMGKTTTVRSIMGLTPVHRGHIHFRGHTIHNWPSYKIAQHGIGLVPEGRQIFPNLTVEENLLATAAQRHVLKHAWTLKRIHDFFPRLAERRHHMGNQLSGGEQQMLAIGRALLTNPFLLILDEACEGLAPLIQQEIWQVLDNLKQQGMSILVIDKDYQALQKLADRYYIIEKGSIAWHGTNAEFSSNPELPKKYLGL
ncbi:MAG: ABC transporter ATP-binding protein [Gammaproteobacteria bacterium]|nr:ABC transporter ATP-binding protein [Gammaproteobacteria bacterium]